MYRGRRSYREKYKDVYYFVTKELEIVQEEVIKYKNINSHIIRMHFTGLSGRHSVLERPLSEVNGRPFFSQKITA